MLVFPLSAIRVVICLTLMTPKPKSQGCWKCLPMACLGECDGLLPFRNLGEGKIVEIIFLQVGFHG
jgi:hypothetical protein